MAKTIEERALEAYPHFSAEYSERVMGAGVGYVKGAIDQQKIDIEKVTSDSTIDELVKVFHNDSLAPCALREVLKGILIEAMED